MHLKGNYLVEPIIQNYTDERELLLKLIYKNLLFYDLSKTLQFNT